MDTQIAPLASLHQLPPQLAILLSLPSAKITETERAPQHSEWERRRRARGVGLMKSPTMRASKACEGGSTPTFQIRGTHSQVRRQGVCGALFPVSLAAFYRQTFTSSLAILWRISVDKRRRRSAVEPISGTLTSSSNPWQGTGLTLSCAAIHPRAGAGLRVDNKFSKSAAILSQHGCERACSMSLDADWTAAFARAAGFDRVFSTEFVEANPKWIIVWPIAPRIICTDGKTWRYRVNHGLFSWRQDSDTWKPSFTGRWREPFTTSFCSIVRRARVRIPAKTHGPGHKEEAMSRLAHDAERQRSTQGRRKLYPVFLLCKGALAPCDVHRPDPTRAHFARLPAPSYETHTIYVHTDCA